MANIGRFFGVGVGPGSPDLLTLRAAEILQTADIICIPRSSDKNDSVALKVAKPHISSTAEIVEISTPMVRDKEILNAEWQSGAQKIAKYLKDGKNVAFITIGDAMLFSTYTYLLNKVQQIIPDVSVESIPGVTSFSATAALLNRALAEGNEKLAIVPAIDDPSELKPILATFPNVVLMKVANKYEQILDILEELGLQDKAVFMSKLGYPDQFYTRDLNSLRGVKREYLSLILVKQEGF
ncbi:precorrin-2 C(20)-methyltransferase [Dendrosporobacter sp. 1207_IL3150]|uniref:precorrin-2 C(20)-methyltransferase n=1 Tax=Dendrosporobacter sp. 1207_IL3150 TaxID=3084054 RepID=UPI002FD888D5